MNLKNSLSYKYDNFDEFVESNGKFILTEVEHNSKKWSQIYDYSLYFHNYEIIYAYLEILFQYETHFHNIHDTYQGRLGDSINKLNRNITSLNPVRSKIVDKVFNYSNGDFEYLLENGEYISINGGKVKTNLDISVFPPSFIKLIDSTKYRMDKINNILE